MDENLTLQSLLILSAGYFLVLMPASALISRVLRHWIDQLPATSNSLMKAGAMIGYLERVLILTFILLDQFTAVGFVLALKAAYRFKDTGDHPQSEYMLMGTFLSLVVTLFIGMAVKFALDSQGIAMP